MPKYKVGDIVLVEGYQRDPKSWFKGESYKAEIVGCLDYDIECSSEDNCIGYRVKILEVTGVINEKYGFKVPGSAEIQPINGCWILGLFIDLTLKNNTIKPILTAKWNF